MYDAYWNLQTLPFDPGSDPSLFFASEGHQGALLKLRYAVENRRDAALLAGAAGIGKTLLIQTLFRQLPEQCSPRAHLVFPQMPPDQLVAYLADELSGELADPAAPLHYQIRRLEATLRQNAEQGRHAVIVIDEAHLLDDAQSLETLRLLLNFRHEARPTATLLLVGQPGILPTLDRAVELDERLAVKCLVRRFTLEETIGYVQHRLQVAGAQQPIFDERALKMLHQLAQGIPQKINRLADLALLVGFAEERAQLGAEQIEAVAEELVAQV